MGDYSVFHAICTNVYYVYFAVLPNKKKHNLVCKL